jgi:hypothetical protein
LVQKSRVMQKKKLPDFPSPSSRCVKYKRVYPLTEA